VSIEDKSADRSGDQRLARDAFQNAIRRMLWRYKRLRGDQQGLFDCELTGLH
jgi:hypothetical protein